MSVRNSQSILLDSNKLRVIVHPNTLVVSHKNYGNHTSHKNYGNHTRVWGDAQVAATTEPLPIKQMPGPRGLKDIPIIGLFLMFKPFTKYTIETFSQMIAENHDKYGDIFKLRTGTKHMVISANVEDAEMVFRTEGLYPRRRLMKLSKVYRQRNNMPLGLGSLVGPEWQKLRSPLNILLNRPKVSLQYLPAQNKVADDFVQVLVKSNLSAEKITDAFFQYAAESAGVVCFNQRLGILDPSHSSSSPKQNLLDAYQTLMTSNHRSMIGLEWKYLITENNEFYQKYSRAMKLVTAESTMYVENVKNALKNKDYSRTQDAAVVDYEDLENNLLAFLITKSNLEIDQITAIIETIMIVGSDSSAKNLAVVLYNLALNPEKQDNVVNEVLDVLGYDNPLTPATLARMPYLKACVKESMRLHFPISNGTLRELEKDTVLSGFLVPKGTNVILNIRRMALNPRFYYEPNSYIPERWLRHSEDAAQSPSMCPHSSQSKVEKHDEAAPPRDHTVAPPPFSYLPFGHGVRSCVGRRFAEMEMQVGVAKVLQKLHVTVDPAYRGLDPVYTPFITPTEHIPFVFKKRTS